MSSVMPPLEDDVFGVPVPDEDQQVAKLRLPQYSMESESSVLGGLLMDNNAWIGWAIYSPTTISIAMSTS